MTKKINKTQTRLNPFVRQKQATTVPANGSSRMVWYLLGIIIFTVIAYLPSFCNLFTNWDDQYYVTNNEHIRSLSFESLKGLLSTFEMGNYHPLTMFTFSLNYYFATLNPFLYHFTNFMLHIGNVLLVFALIYKMCGDIKVAAIASLLFGIHPLHVESVAWVSERKDVLYAFFYLAALYVYVWYLNKQEVKSLMLVYLFFILSLFSKGAAVTLPLALFLFDYYLGRKFERKVLFEKIPFFILSIIFGIIGIYAQRTTDALDVATGYSYFERILFSSYAIISYLWKILTPIHLSCFYDYPAKINGSYPLVVYIAPFLVIALIYLLFRFRSARFGKDLLFASLFFMCHIILVLQLMPIGKALYADRYTYVSSLGFFLLAGKGAVFIWNSRTGGLKKVKPLFVIFSGGIVALFIYFSFNQCQVWQDSFSLWNNAINNTPSALAYYNRGTLYMESNNTDAAIADFDETLQFKSDYLSAYINRASLLQKKGMTDKALADCKMALSISPQNVAIYATIASCLIDKKDFKGCILYADSAIEKDKNYSLAYYNKGLALFYLAQYEDAIASLSKFIAINPELKEAYFNRSGCYYALKNIKAALADALKAKELGYDVDPKYIEALQK